MFLLKGDIKLTAFSIYNIVYGITTLFRSFYSRLFVRKAIKKQEPIKREESVLEKTQKYITKQQDKFTKKVENIKDDQICKMNANIPPVFYSKKDYSKILEDDKNPLEREWKTRILFETTPKGNVLMYYDSYKQGFSYYSDANSIDYKLLNAIAMKYVLTFQCVDFFVDNETLFDSPLIKVHFVDEKPAPKTDSATGKTFVPDVKNGPFVKYKKANQENVLNASQKEGKNEGKNEGKKEGNKEEDKKTETREYNRNRFICLGKMKNFNAIQPLSISKIKTMRPFTSPFLANLAGETTLQKTVMSFKEYKQAMRTTSA